MQYVMLIYENEADFDARDNDKKEKFWGAWMVYHKALVDAGVHIGGNPLERASTATTLRLRNDKRHVQDGPFADTKEQLGGYIILDLPSLDKALEWAGRCPAAATGTIEVRPIYQASMQR